MSYLLKRYAVVASITLVALRVIAYAFEAFADFDFELFGAILGVLIPALDAGETYARRERTMHVLGYIWKISFRFVLMMALVSFSLVTLSGGGWASCWLM